LWHWTQTLAICSPFFGSALASSGSIGSGPAAAPGAGVAVATCSAPAGRKTGFSSGFERTSWPARIPDTIATIIAVMIEAMTLFHSKDDIDDLSDRLGTTGINYHASGVRTNRASCRCPISCKENP